jgi:hypothetical protein
MHALITDPERFVYDDGGRWAAGFRPRHVSDCVCRAIAIATPKPYSEVYKALSAIGWTDRRSRYARDADGLVIPREWANERDYIESLGWQWAPTMRIGTGCKVHLRADELPPGRLIVRVSGHLAAMIDGVIHDNHDCSRGGTRCVYGYFHLSS